MAVGRAAVDVLAGVRRLAVLVGVFLFALALTSVAVSGTAHRTVILEYGQSSVAGH